MPAMRYTFSAADMLSDELRAALRRRLHEIIGAALLGIAGIAAIALATWSVQDPSLSHATNAPVRNMLGLPGAIGADLLMQLLGIATIALLLPLAAWGWRLLTHRPRDRERVRLILWILGAGAAAGFASCLPASKSWPLPTGLGGVIGDAMLRVPAWVFGAPLSGVPRFSIAVVIATAAFTTLALAAGFGWRRGEDEETSERPARKAKRKTDDAEEDREPQGFVSLGRLYHFLYSVKARIALIPALLFELLRSMLPWRRRHRVVPLRHDPSAVILVEPHAEPYSNPADDQAEEIEDEESEVEVAPRKKIKPSAR